MIMIGSLHSKRKSNFVVDGRMVAKVMQEATSEFERRTRLEHSLFLQMNMTKAIRTPAKYHQKSTISSPQSKSVMDSAVVAELSLLSLIKQGVSFDQLQSGNADYLLKEWTHCYDKYNANVTIQCQRNYRYRSVDGKCNNLRNPVWGSTLQPQRRSLPAVYDDAVSGARTLSVVQGTQLPTARQLSLSFTNASLWLSSQEKKLSMLFLTWGQFIDHDMVSTVASKGHSSFLCSSR